MKIDRCCFTCAGYSAYDESKEGMCILSGKEVTEADGAECPKWFKSFIEEDSDNV